MREFIVLIRIPGIGGAPSTHEYRRISAANEGDVQIQIQMLSEAGILGRDAHAINQTDASDTWHEISRKMQEGANQTGLTGTALSDLQSKALASELQTLSLLNPAGQIEAIGGADVAEGLDLAAPQSIFRNWLRDRMGVASPSMALPAGTRSQRNFERLAPMIGAAAQTFFPTMGGDDIEDPQGGLQTFLGGLDTDKGIGAGIGGQAREMLERAQSWGMTPPAGLSGWVSPSSTIAPGALEANALAQAALSARVGSFAADRFGQRITDEAANQYWDQFAATGTQPGSYASWMLSKTGFPMG